MVHLARQILERKDANQLAESEKMLLKNRIVKVENDIQKLIEMMKNREKMNMNKLKGINDEAHRKRFYF